MKPNMIITGCFVVSCLSGLVQADDHAKLPDNIRQEMQFLVGDWGLIANENGTPHPGRASVRWANRGTVLLMTFRSDIHSATGISSWDPATNEIVENWFGFATGRVENRYRIHSKSEWKGTVKRSELDGTTTNGTNRVEKNGPDSFRYSETIGKRTMNIENRRITSPASEQVKAVSGFIGTWEAQLQSGGTRRWQFRWSPEGDFVNNQMTGLDAKGKVQWTLNGMLGSSKDKKSLTNWCVTSQGTQTSFVWQKADGHSWNVTNTSGDKKWTFTLKNGALHSEHGGKTLIFRQVQ